jgi:sarcosine oxidase gamma subunit
MATTPEKTAVKTAKPSPINGNRLPVGAHPGNTGGKKGRSGRKPDEFKAMMRAMVSHAQAAEALQNILRDASHPQFVQAYRMAAEFGYGKAQQHIEHTGEVKTGGVLVVPGQITPDQWAVAAEAQQAALVDQKRAMGEQYGVGR